MVKLQRFYICEGSRGLEAKDARNGRVRPDVEEHLVARQHARPAVIKFHLKSFRCYEAPGPHDQCGAAPLIVLQVCGNFAFDHIALPLTNFCHVDCDGTNHCAELRGMAGEMCDLRTPN